MTTVTKVLVHPLVLLSVVDHFNRVTKGASRIRVAGVLLGKISRTGVVDVSNSFAVPFEEDSRDDEIWYLDQNYVEDMYGMFRKVTSSEVIVGWYTTGPEMKCSDINIHQLFRKYTPHPVYVIVDVLIQKIGVPTKAYVCVEETKDRNKPPQLTFGHVESEVTALEAEEIGVEHLLRGVKDSTITDLANCVSRRLSSVDELARLLRDIIDYLTDVIAGSYPVNHQILYILQDIFNKLPGLHDEMIREAFVTKTNDKMVVMYIASIWRAILSLHDLINNKFDMREQEREEDVSATATKKPTEEEEASSAK